MNKVKGITVGTYLTKTIKNPKDKGLSSKEICNHCKMKDNCKYRQITKFENGIKDGVQYTNQQKGNYAEMKMDQYYDSIGFERISQDRVTGLNDAGHQGLDGVYQNKGTNEYIVGEAKYNTSKLSTLKDGTKQMSKKWIGGKRLEEAVGTEKANLIGNNYERNLYNIKKNGSLNFKVLNN